MLLYKLGLILKTRPTILFRVKQRIMSTFLSKCVALPSTEESRLPSSRCNRHDYMRSRVARDGKRPGYPVRVIMLLNKIQSRIRDSEK